MLAEAKATAAREEAEAAAADALQKIGSHMSARALEAADRHADAEEHNEIGRAKKLEGLADSIERTVDLEDRVVGRLVWQSDTAKGREDRKLAALDRELTRQTREEVRADAADAKSMRQAQRSFDSYERHASQAKSAAARELRDVEKQLEAVKAQHRTDIKKLEAAEAETAAQLWGEADALRRAAGNGTLPSGKLQALLDVTQETLDNLTNLFSDSQRWAPGSNATGAWFEERVEGLHSKSAAASAHMVEAVKFKAEAFVRDHNGYNDQQFVGLLARLLNSTMDDFRVFHEASSRISARMQGFQQMNPENLTSALSLALDGVTGNIEFRNNLLRVDTNRLAHSTPADACEQLAGVFSKNMQPAYNSLGHMKDQLDSMTKVVPSIVSLQPCASSVLDNRTHNVLDMAYAEYLAYRTSATILMTQVTPVILERLRCSFSGAPALARLGRGAAALALAVWFAL